MKTTFTPSFTSPALPLHAIGVDRFRLLWKGWGLKVLSLLLVVMVGGMSWGQNTNATWGANASSAWYTGGNWAGGAYPGIQGVATSNTNIATFTSAFTGTTSGINMGTNSLNLGAISLDNTRTTATNIGNSSATSGALRLYGATVNGVANTILRNNGSGTLTLQAAQNGAMGLVLSNSTDNIINIDGTGDITISSIISGANKLTKSGSGSGVLTLSGVNSYSGSTTISSGILRLGAANGIPVAATGGGVILNGGTLSSGATTGFSEGVSGSTNMGTLALSDNSTIALGTGSHNLFFASSNLVSWTSSKILTITGWTGTVGTGTTGTAGKIFVGSSSSGLTDAQLAQIKFTISSINYPAMMLSTGEIVPTLNLSITTIANQTAGTGFSVTVTARNFDGTPTNVTNATGIALTSSTNTIGGTTTGTIAASSNSVTISNVTLTVGNIATITATRSSGNYPKTTTSAAFNVSSASNPSLAVTGTTSHGSVCPGSPATTKTYTITNTGTAASNVVVSSSDVQFAVSNLSSTSIGATNGTATYDVTFTPSSSGAKTATITVYYNTSTSATTSSLTGTGATSVTQAVTSSSPTLVTAQSATLNGNYTAAGVCPATIEKGFVYSLSSTNNNPLVNGTGVTNTTVTLGSTGTYSLTLSGLASSADYCYKSYVFDGTTYTYGTVQTFTTSAALAISGVLNNGSVCPNVPASAVTYTVTNNGSTTVSGVGVTSSDAQFVVGNISSSTIAPSGTATYTVTFTPSSAGSKSSTITVSGTSVASVTNTLTGTGTTPVTGAVVTNAVGSIVNTTATLNGSVTTLGVCPATSEKGFVYSVSATNSDPLVGGTGVTKTAVSGLTTGAFTLALTGLSTTTNYTVKAYVFDGSTYIYGSPQNFSTLAVATKLGFGTAPGSTAYLNTNMSSFTVQAQRSDNTVDSEYAGTVTLSSTGTITGTTATFVNGVATFSATQFTTSTGVFTITASLSPLTSVTSSSISVTNAPVTLASWNFGTVSPGSAASNLTTSNLTVSNVSVGNNNGSSTLLSTTSPSNFAGASTSYNAGAATIDDVLNTSTSTYFQFDLAPSSGYFLSITSFGFGSRSTGTGPASYVLRSSLDNYSSNIASGTFTTNSTWVSFTNSGLSLIGGNGSNITFRLYGYGGTGASINTVVWRIDDLSISGTISCSTPAQPSTISGNASVCTGSSQTYSVTAVSGVAYTWSLPNNSTGSSSTNSISSTIGSAGSGTITVTPYNSASGCFSYTGASRSLAITINSLPSTPAATDASRCGTGTVTISATPSTNETIDWYAAPSGGTALASGSSSSTLTFTTPSISSTTIYYAEARNLTTGCTSATRTAVTATVNALPFAPTANNSSRCGTGTVSISATPSTNETIDWYASATGGAALASGSSSSTLTFTTPSISSTTIYYAEARNLTTGCTSATRTAVTATVNANNTASVASSTPTLCISTPLTGITHTTTGATGIGTATGLPAGVSAAWTSNTITISGTPTESGTFNYSIPLTGGCGSVSATGTITVTPANTVGTASSTQTLFVNTPLTSITHTTSGANNIGTATGLPAGVSASWANDIITISGTPTALGTLTYSIPLTGGCGSVNATGTITVVNAYTWTGAVSSLWSTSGNWSPNGVPTSANNVNIPASSTNELEVLSSLTIDANATFTLKSNAKLTLNGIIDNNGTFTIESGATLVQTGSGNNSGNGSYNVKQNVTGSGVTVNGLTTPNGRFWYMGPALSNATSTAFLASAGNQLWQWNEANFTYAPVTSGNLIQGKSYVLRSGQTTETINFSGTGLSNGTVTVPNLTRTGTAHQFRGCHLVSNPYPSYLDWELIDKTNLSPTMYIRTASANSIDVLETYNADDHFGTSISGPALTKFIAPMQGFWVKVAADTQTGSMTMTNAMRSHQPTGSGLRSTPQDFPAFLRFNMLDGQNKDQIILFMTPNATSGIDSHDSEKMSASGYAQFYSTVNAKKLVINGMKNVKAKTSVPLTLEMPSSKSYTFQAEEFNIEDGLILLEDKQEGVIQDLTINPTYSFFGNAGTNATRFVVHFQLANAPILVGGPMELESLGSDELTSENIQIVSNNQGTIIIRMDEGFKPEGSVRIFDASGRLVEQSDFNDQETTIQLKEQAGMYFVEVSAGKLMVKKKIVIE